MKLLYTVCALFVGLSAFAQQLPYTLNYLDEPYASFEDGTDAMPEIWDNPIAVIPIGFEFDFFGVPIESFNLTGLGAMLTCTNPEATIQSIFLPYSSDLADAGLVTGTHTSIISYKTTGVEPERVFHMQWEDCALKGEINDSNTADARVNVQIRLYEGTNDIAIHYGPHTVSDNTLLHDGNPGPSIGFYANLSFASGLFEDYWLVGGSTTNPQPLWGDPLDENDNSFNPLDNDPDDGTLYYFATGTVGVNDPAIGDVLVYPNPAEDVLHVSLGANLQDASVDVLDLTGKAVIELQQASSLQRIDIAELPSGVYFLRVHSSTKAWTQRFVKE